MNTVQPIRDMNTVMDIARYLKQNNERDYVMFTTGIYSGLRVSDILKLRVKDVRGKDYIIPLVILFQISTSAFGAEAGTCTARFYH